MSEPPIYKVVLVGDGNVGKTSLVRRFCEGKFEESRILTIGVDFQIKTVQLGERTLRLSIWDVAGQDRFRTFRDQFYSGTLAAGLIYDVTSPATFFNLPRWRDEVLASVPGVPMVVIGNKSDLGPVVPPTEAEGWARFEGRMPFLQTSALTSENVEQFFQGLAYLAYKRREALNEMGKARPQVVDVGPPPDEQS
ncbi:MAG: GTP-binding protein [Chloroflexi bacterium]|nr:GTP-binding protein [Chloroflexota bacterium]